MVCRECTRNAIDDPTGLCRNCRRALAGRPLSDITMEGAKELVTKAVARLDRASPVTANENAGRCARGIPAGFMTPSELIGANDPRLEPAKRHLKKFAAVVLEECLELYTIHALDALPEDFPTVEYPAPGRTPMPGRDRWEREFVCVCGRLIVGVGPFGKHRCEVDLTDLIAAR